MTRSTIAAAMAAFALITLTGCGDTPDDGCIIGQWRGSYVTEAVNVQLDMTITTLNAGDAGNWSFTGADDVDLGSGDLQAWQNGASATIIIFTALDGPSSALVGAVNGACDHMEGDISSGASGPFGGFSLDRI